MKARGDIDFRASNEVLSRRPKRVPTPPKDLCRTCETFKDCVKPCTELERLLWEPGRVHERTRGRNKMTPEYIVLFPWGKEFSFSSLGVDMEKALLNEYPEESAVEFASDDYNFSKTAIFVERFFKKTPRKELAERFGCSEHVVSCQFNNAVKDVEGILSVMDSKRNGKTSVMNKRFNDMQKAFLLRYVFGFTPEEVAEVVGRYTPGTWNVNLKAMARKVQDVFEQEAQP